MILQLLNKSRSDLLVSLSLKFIGMVLLFGGVKLITSKASIATYGQYSQSVSLLVFFVSVATLGYGQSFIRDSANLERSVKRELYLEKSNIIRNTSLICAPFLFIVSLYWIKNSFLSSLIITTTYLLFSTSKLRFTYIRSSHKASISEVPELIVKQATLIGVLMVVGSMTISLSALLIAYLVASLSIYIAQMILDEDLYPYPGRNIKVVKNVKKIKGADLKLWALNCLTTFKDFLELSAVAFMVSEQAAGQFKVLLLIQLTFMSVFNSLNLINSAKYASMIDKGDTKELNKLLFEETKNGLILLVIGVPLFIIFANFFDIFKYFDLPANANILIAILLIIPIFNSLIGPVSQLSVHYRMLDQLTIGYSIRVCGLIGLFVFENITGTKINSLVNVMSCFVILEILYLSFLAIVLYNKKTYRPPALGYF